MEDVSNLTLWLIGGAIIFGFATLLWPLAVLILCLGIPTAMLCLGIPTAMLCLGVHYLTSRRDKWLANRRELIERADRQHAHIMEGDEDAGTYGEYPPAV